MVEPVAVADGADGDAQTQHQGVEAHGSKSGLIMTDLLATQDGRMAGTCIPPTLSASRMKGR